LFLIVVSSCVDEYWPEMEKYENLLVVKLSLFIFPVIFATIDNDILSGRKSRSLYYSFIAGCLCVALGLLTNAFVDFKQSYSADEFYYTNLASYLHPSYLSMYLNFAISIIIVVLIGSGKRMGLYHKIILGFLASFFFLFIILLSSKAGIMTLVILLCAFILYLILNKKQYFHALYLSIISIIYFMISFSVFQMSADRFYESKETLKKIDQIKSENNESTAERIILWRTASDIIQQNIIFGLGIGDVKDHLTNAYKDKQMWNAYKKQRNAHNQYLQTLLSAGLIGFMILMFCLMVPFWLSLKGSRLLYMIFILIIGFNFLFESMLCRQAGVVFYAFFNALMYYLFIQENYSKQHSLSADRSL